MPVEVWMPQLGESVTEGTITRWLKAVGDPVAEYEPLVEVNTDKVDTEIPSPASGILLEIIIAEGVTVQAGAVLAWIGAKDEKPGSIPLSSPPVGEIAASPAISTSTTPTPFTPPARDRDLGFISPVVSRIASEHKIDLSQVTGTGQGGRITKKDLLAFIENRPSERDIPLPASSLEPKKTGPTAGTVLPLTPVRKLIADHMVLSKHTSPHVTTIMEADLSRVIAHRQAHKEPYSRDGVNLTFTAYFVSAAAEALKAFPLVNSSWGEQGIVMHPVIHIGMAASMGEEGLIVPVIKNADGYSLLGLARTINDLANRARAHKLQPEEVKGGTFTITNHGTSGSLFATPIINQPQCAILGVGAIQKRVVVITQPENGDVIAIRPMVYLGLTFDHRILDGAIADAFLSKLIGRLQAWS